MLNKVDAFLREKDEVIETKDTTTKAQEKPLDEVTIEPESTIVEEIQQTISYYLSCDENCFSATVQKNA